jgi:hypothetical protein
MRILSLALVLVAAAVSTSSATIVNFSSTPAGRSAVDASLTTLADGDQFLVGTFANPGALSLSLGSVANIFAAGGWSQFDGAQTIVTAAGNGGKVAGTATDNTASANAFNLKDAYIVIFNTASAATATQMGIFRASAGVPPWVFPTNTGGIGDSLTLDMNDTTIAAIGGIGSVSSSPSRLILAALVPEPGIVSLLAPGLVGMLGFRRLRRA